MYIDSFVGIYSLTHSLIYDKRFGLDQTESIFRQRNKRVSKEKKI